MTEFHKEYIDAPRTFTRSDHVIEATYCMDSGKLMTEACRADPRGNRSERGYFAKGTQPLEYCDVHRLVAYDSVHGGVASPDCPAENLKYVGLINVSRSFPVQIYVTDAQYTWRDIGTETVRQFRLCVFLNLWGTISAEFPMAGRSTIVTAKIISIISNGKNAGIRVKMFAFPAHRIIMRFSVSLFSDFSTLCFR